MQTQLKLRMVSVVLLAGIVIFGTSDVRGVGGNECRDKCDEKFDKCMEQFTACNLACPPPPDTEACMEACNEIALECLREQTACYSACQ
jgi:hypothetical protein